MRILRDEIRALLTNKLQQLRSEKGRKMTHASKISEEIAKKENEEEITAKVTITKDGPDKPQNIQFTHTAAAVHFFKQYPLEFPVRVVQLFVEVIGRDNKKVWFLHS